jgi:hypothetical protein
MASKFIENKKKLQPLDHLGTPGSNMMILDDGKRPSCGVAPLSNQAECSSQNHNNASAYRVSMPTYE